MTVSEDAKVHKGFAAWLAYAVRLAETARAWETETARQKGL
jgi:hypothetical protein